MRKKYRIKQTQWWVDFPTVKIQMRTFFGWRTIWAQEFIPEPEEEEYARKCAEELLDHLNETI